MQICSPESPIGLFDSGVGGLTIVQAALRQLPRERLIYLGDTARVPYGNKSPQAIVRYTLNSASFLMKQKIKLLIVACFTASSHALQILQHTLPIPVIGVIQCGIEELIRTTLSRRVAILGTASTIRSGIAQSLLHEHRPSITVFPIACPLFVPFIEEGLLDHPGLRLMAGHYLAPLHKQKIDSALLACTHYPIIRPIIQEAAGEEVSLVEPAAACAKKAQELLASRGWLNDGEAGRTDHEFYATDDPEKFSQSAELFLGSAVGRVRYVDLD